MPRGLIAIILAVTSLPARGADPLADLEDAQRALFERVAPAVVVIERGGAIGAGFAVAPGVVVTAGHVVADATVVTVTLAGGRVVPGTVTERSADGLDLALVRVAETPARTLALAGPPARTGAFVASVGHDDGNRWTLATGIVANAQADGPDGALLRLQLPLRPGASGGPVVDRAGNVLGIVTHGGPGEATFAVRSAAALRSLSGLAALAPGRQAPGPGRLARAPLPADQGSVARPTP